MASEDSYEIGDYGYGKSAVKVLHVRKEGLRHTIREFEVSTALKLNSHKDYKFGDNRDIVATDTQKNTVYLLAKKFGVRTPEEFGVLVCRHFLATYSHIIEVDVKVEAYPWERVQQGSVHHNHAFVFTPSATRTAYVQQKRNGPANIKSCLSNMRILKTTQSSFENFYRDDYTTLPDAKDRIFSTVVDASWVFSTGQGVDFDNAWDIVKEAILDKFAGCPQKGHPSPSVQHTLYLAEKVVLDKVKEIASIEMVMPNKHYFNFDFGRFPATLTMGQSNEEVFQPVDKPAGMIRAELRRKDTRSKL